jgi:hypothetical protein
MSGQDKEGVDSTCKACGARLSIEDHECDQCRECGRDLGQDCGGEGVCHQPPSGCDGCEMEHTLPPDRYKAHTTKTNIDALNARSAPPIHRNGCDAVIGGECRCGRESDALSRPEPRVVETDLMIYAELPAIREVLCAGPVLLRLRGGE